MAPLALSFAAPDGTLEASARAVFEPRRVDVSTGRPLRPGASSDATCASGAEPDCLAPGDAPESNRAAFDALCATSRGFTTLDPQECRLKLMRSQRFAVPGVSVAQIYSSMLAGSPTGINVIANSAVAGPLSRAPLVALSIDAGDGVPTGGFASSASIATLRFALPGFTEENHHLFQTLAQVLTREQQALLGCGDFYSGTTCDGGVLGSPLESGPGGIDLLHADAGALVQSFAPLGDESFLATDTNRAQPGTIDGPAPECDRDGLGGSVALLPGCRGPVDVSYDVSKDGPSPTETSLGFPAGIGGVPTLGSALLGPVAYTQGHPFTGQIWRSELAALSWNLQVVLVATTARPTDPSLSDPRYGFDPALAYRTDGCSYVKPQLCENVRTFAGGSIEILPGDPQGQPARRWAWEYGAQYATESASGIFAGLAGGSVFAFGPAAPTAGGAAAAAAPILASDGLLAIIPDPLADGDGDGISNAGDRCPATPDPLQADTDSDGIGDACDDCTMIANASQRDTNGDGVGNACDADLDGSGIVNFADLARMKSVFFQSDPDADLDGSGVVNFADLARMKQHFFQLPGPSALAP